jgi:hypothetical protein
VTAVSPRGNAANKIHPDMLSPSATGPIDPRPRGTIGVSGAIVPAPAGTVDDTATYRGAFKPSLFVPPWTGFTSLAKAGIHR